MRLNNKYILLLALSLFYSSQILSQEVIKSREYPRDFRPPLDLAPSLAGSFGEIRSNHFHSGLDYRTNQREGYPVYAVADGYISRLRVQIGGFGNAVYINHPNGYTSVYAHLQRFNNRIALTIKDFQYRKESYDVDFPLIPIEIPVKKGDIIAWSGNTGSSGGPHLHFELRDTKTEETINPQLFGIDIPDKVKPVISGLYMYRLNGQPFSEKTPSQYFQVSGSNGNYQLNQSPVINFDNEVGFGIVTHDQQRAGGNKNGVYSIELFLDGTRIYTSALERFAFENSRAINSHIDYPALISSGRTIQKSFIEPGNPLRIYPEAINRGLVNLNDDSVHQMRYIIKDVIGNTSMLNFRIKRNPKATLSTPETNGMQWFKHADSSRYSTDKIHIAIPAGVLYSDINFKYSSAARPQNGYSAVHHIHTRSIPVHKNYHLWIKPDANLPEELKDKAVVVDTRGAYHGGVYENGFIRASPRTFGSFYIRIDNVEPVIRPVNISDGKSMAGISKIILKLSDNLSGIRSFRGTIDGQWVLFEYDSKTSTLWHTFEESLSAGKHLLQFTATDMKMNIRTYNVTFYR
ncbi:M23 family metallopeptidase [Paradesertivirga mongoliensis]|uniref:M23 family metallopeptidase n=1 Tax=Paradesertivirga mongoliensis TaxID=2100740 RepID=A0ABW4ZR09_9SPHI|nr:M23 family metallopeptidase [Pedobacter mongoliensis]